MRLEDSFEAQIQISTFTNCSSLKFGGALYSSDFYLKDVSFNNNKARFGGAISRSFKNSLDVNIKFSNN